MSSEETSELPGVFDLLSATIQDVTSDFPGYLMAGIPGFVVQMFGVFLMLFLVFGGYAFMFFAMVMGAAMGDDLGAMLGMIVGMLGFFLSIMLGGVLLAMMVAPLNASVGRHLWIRLTSEEKHPLTVNSGIDRATVDIGAVLTVTLIQGAAGMLGLMFFYVGALVPAVLFSFALPGVIVHRLSAIEALKRSAQHAMAHLGWHAGVALLGLGIVIVLANIPFVGGMIAGPIHLAYILRAYKAAYGTDGALVEA